MANTVSGFPYFEDLVESVRYLGLTQQIDILNGQSRGAISVSMSGSRKGRKPESTFVNVQTGLVQTRDPAGTGTLTPVRFSGATHRAVKVFRSAPADYALQDFRDLGLDTDTGATIYGQQLADRMVLDFINTAAAALIGGITKVGATAIHDVSGAVAGTNTLSMLVLNNGKKKFGDQAQNLVAMLTHSIPYFNLLGNSIVDEASAFHVAGTVIEAGNIKTMGLTTLISDTSALEEDESTSTATNNFVSLLLPPGAVEIRALGMRNIIGPVMGDATTTPENITIRILEEWEYEIQLRGVSYTTAAVVNPSNAVLAASSNWEIPGSPALDRKQGPGVIVRTDGVE